MRTSVALALLAVVGCDGAPDVAAQPAPPAKPRVAPHGSLIVRLAVTRAGDAALALDAGGELRLWPALDGTLEPVVVAGPVPRQLALVRTASGELVAALVDDAGGLAVRRFGGDGTLRATTTLSPDPGFDDVVADGDDFLAARRDDRIVRIHDGAVAATLELRPGERLSGLFAGAAIVARRDGRELRRIAAPLAWGAAFALPELLVDLAISPSGTRVAGFKRDGELLRLELAGHTATIVARHDAMAPEGLVKGVPAGGVAFVDDDHVYWGEGRLESWAGALAQVEPLADVASAGAIIGGLDGGLAVVRGGRTRYLGYGEAAPRGISGAGDGFAFTVEAGVRVLDGSARAVRVAPLPGVGPVVALDDRLAVVHTSLADGRLQYELVDLVSGAHAHPAPPPLRTGQHVAVEPATHVVALYDNAVVRRYRIDPTRLELATLPERRGFTRIDFAAPLDPAAAGGADLVITGWRDQDYRIETYAGGTTPRTALGIPRRHVIGADRTGAVYVFDGTDVEVYRGDKRVGGYRLPAAPATAVLHASGALATFSAAELLVRDGATGLERWHTPLRGTISAAFSTDGATLAAATRSGLATFDVATGLRRGGWCGAGFGIFDKRLPGGSDGRSVCAD